ncbi:MAG: thioredoxin domain-containing protein [Thermoanaerobaculia bacterium]
MFGPPIRISPPVAVLLTFFATAFPALAQERAPAPRSRHAAATPCPSPNRLARESSAYLLAHACNPVEWYPWSDEAFATARTEDKPVFLSIGYSSCHWCQVMESQSFSDPKVAALINATFIPVLVDREERPDVDAVYQHAAALLGAGGGWPLNLILTPEKTPFFAATYIPPADQGSQQGFQSLVPRVSALWIDRSDAVETSAAHVWQALRVMSHPAPVVTSSKDVLSAAYDAFRDRFDQDEGGFLPSPKFPLAPRLLYLLAHSKLAANPSALRMVETTLDAIRDGGIYDQIGFGVHRYAMDRRWREPHFEKMLADQSLLAIVSTEAWQLTHAPRYQRLTEELLGYVERRLTAPDGSFRASENADSDGREGAFYLWNEREIVTLLGADAKLFLSAYQLADPETGEAAGGPGILIRRDPPPDLSGNHRLSKNDFQRRLASSRERLFAARERRAHPAVDDAILADWNGLQIVALATAARAYGNPDDRIAAERAADALLRTMKTRSGRLLHRRTGKESGINGQLDDYAFAVWGLLELYETDFDLRYLTEAVDLSQVATAEFGSPDGRFFTTSTDTDLPIRLESDSDEALPSGSAVMALNLLRLAAITGREDLSARSAATLARFSGAIQRDPLGHAMMLRASEMQLGPSYEIVIAGEPDASDTRAMLQALRTRYLPNAVVILRPSGAGAAQLARLASFTRDQKPLDGKATAYVCVRHACRLPTTDPAKMLELLR